MLLTSLDPNVHDGHDARCMWALEAQGRDAYEVGTSWGRSAAAPCRAGAGRSAGWTGCSAAAQLAWPGTGGPRAAGSQ